MRINGGLAFVTAGALGAGLMIAATSTASAAQIDCQNNVHMTYPNWPGSTGESNNQRDCVYGNSDNNDIYLGESRDEAWGGLGVDHIWGEEGADIVHGEESQDRIYGGGGDDALYAGAHDDKIWDGPGEDIIVGAEGYDIWCQASDGVGGERTGEIEEVVPASEC